MNRNRVGIIAGILIVIIILIIIFYKNGCNVLSIATQDDTSKLQSQITTLQDSVNSLNAKMDTCVCADKKPKPKVQKKRTTTYIPPTPPPVKEKVYDFTPPISDLGRENRDNTSVSPGEYLPLADGDMYITLTEDGKHPKYVISKSLLDPVWGSDYQLNWNGSKQYFQDEGNTLVFIDRNVTVTEGFLVGKHTWGVYAGRDQGWDAYLQHELVKPAIMAVRGRLDGRISNDDIREIGKHVAAVRQGKIIPNGVIVRGSDGKEYEGWKIVTEVTYKVKTSR